MTRSSAHPRLLPLLVLVAVAILCNCNVAHGGSKIEKFCSATDYKDLCVEALTAVAKSDEDSPIELVKAAIKAVITHIEKASKTRDEVAKRASQPIDKAALEDCKELFQYAVQELQASISQVGDKNLHTMDDRVHEIRNWLSAVVSYQETCKDAIQQPDLKSAMSNGLLNATQLTSNALAIVSGISQLASAINLPFNFSSFFGRHLVEEGAEEDSEGYPSWFSSSDRKLLAAPNSEVKPNVVVAKDGSGNYKTINDALKNMHKGYSGRYVIYVKAGTYNEYVEITKDMPNVMMYGDGARKTMITGSKSNADGITTMKTASFAAIGEGFIAKAMGFQNTAGPEKHQAVALRVQSDMSVFYFCRMDGHQDTLYAQTHRQFYRNCVISGTIDFIFGDSAVIIQNSRIIVRTPMKGQKNTLTASGRSDKRQVSGIVLQGCKVVPEKRLEPVRFDYPTYLGRPWRMYATTLVMESYLTDLIQPAGWLEWDGNFALDTLTYAEYGNRGPGANTDKRVKWKGVKVFTKKEAQAYTASPFIQGDKWLKATGAPFVLGLTT